MKAPWTRGHEVCGHASYEKFSMAKVPDALLLCICRSCAHRWVTVCKPDGGIES